jgi:hypothetical protein
MSEMNQNELHLAHGMIYEGTGAFQDALNEFDLVPRVESGDAIDAMERSTFALAHLGRKDEALHRLAQFIVEYHFPEPMGDDLATQLTKIVPGVPATTTYHS